MANSTSESLISYVDYLFDSLVKSRFIEMFGSNRYPKKMIKDLVVQDEETTFIDHPEVERFVTLSSHGKGAKQRIIKDGKIPVKFTAYRVKAGQFIYSRIDARNGAFALVPDNLDGAVVSKDFPIFDIKTQLVLPDYFINAVLQDSFVAQIQNDSFGATNRQRVKEEVFGKYTIPWPPIEEQKAFVELVKQVDKSKVIFQKSFKSRFIELFGDPISNPKGWEKKKLHDLLLIERGGSPRPIDEFITEDEDGLNWIKIGDAKEGSYYIDSVKEKIKPEGLKKTREVEPGDLLLSNSMSFGKPYIMKIPGCIHDGWLVLRDSKDRFNKLFLCIALGYPSVTQAFKGSARGAVVNNLNKDLVGALDFIVPPRDLQDQFVDFVHQVDKSKFEIKNAVEKMFCRIE